MVKKVGLLILLLGVSSFSNDTATKAQVLENGISLAVASHYVCAMANSVVKCWFNTDDKFTFLQPLLEDVEQVSGGFSGACWLNKQEVRCGDPRGYGKALTLPVKNPRSLSGGGNQSCLIDDDGVKCWDGRGNIAKDLPKFVNPRQVTVGGKHSCVLDDNGVLCWGENLNWQLKVPPLINPRQVSAGYEHTCALDSEGVKCWGRNDYDQRGVVPLKNPRQISAGSLHSCAIDDNGVHCWGVSRRRHEIKVPPLSNPIQVSCGNDYTCALDANGVRCWSLYSSETLRIPTEFSDARYLKFSLDELNEKLEALAKISYLSKGNFYSGLAKAVSKLPTKHGGIKPRYLAMLFAGTLIEDTDSPIFIDSLIPIYRISKARLERENHLSLLNLEVSPLTLSLSLETVRLALNGSKPILTSAADRESLEKMISQIGQLQAQAESSAVLESTDRLHSILLANEKLVETLTTEARTRGFGIVLKLVEQHLKAGHL